MGCEKEDQGKENEVIEDLVSIPPPYSGPFLETQESRDLFWHIPRDPAKPNTCTSSAPASWTITSSPNGSATPSPSSAPAPTCVPASSATAVNAQTASSLGIPPNSKRDGVVEEEEEEQQEESLAPPAPTPSNTTTISAFSNLTTTTVDPFPFSSPSQR
ncbi:hypothetical protein F5879DRAFT_994890 [Lentinula edodes]|nr:hypothetical protein F5879DRAFT_994890 [Lentinula edodes]